MDEKKHVFMVIDRNFNDEVMSVHATPEGAEAKCKFLNDHSLHCSYDVKMMRVEY